LGCTLALSSILGREFCKYQENPNKELDFFNEVNPFLEVSAPPIEQSLVFGTYYGITDLDPHYAYDTSSNKVINQVVEHLYQFNISDSDLPIIPWLASDFPTISPDGTEYIITLRQGIKFHDGSDLNAVAVKWSFDRLCYFMNYSGNADLPAPFNVPLPVTIPPTQLGILYKQPDGKRIINKTEVLSTYQVKITLNAPKASFLSLLCCTGSGILSPESTPPLDYYQLSDTLIGTGPFKYVGYIPLYEVSFEGFTDYWGTPDNTGPTQLETLIYSIVPDPTNGLLSGVIDLIDSVDPSFIPVFQADPDISCEEYGNTLTVAWITFNYLHLDKAMRHAVSYALNYSYIVDVVYDEIAIRWPTYIPNGIPYANYSLDAATFDRTVARNKLLTDPTWGPICSAAGLTGASTDAEWIAVADGSTPLAHYNYTWNIGNSYRENIGVRLAFDLKYIGVKLDVNAVVWGDLLDMIIVDREKMDMYALGWAPDYLDPENYINPIWSNVSDINGGNFYEPDVQVLMDDALTETDPVVRGNMYWMIQKLMVEEYMPGMTLITGINYDAWQTYVHGWVPNPMDRAWFYPVYIESDDLTPPDITIQSPVSDQVFGVYAPTFTITIIDESPLDSTWYTIDGGVTNYTFSGLIGTVNQTAWDDAGIGSISLTFYANDTLGNLGSETVNIFKDIAAPDITIHSPLPNQEFGVDAPTYNITITSEYLLHSLWYTIDGGVTNYTSYGLTGAINQNAWDSASQGNILITFSAEDDTGKIGTSSVTVIKSIPSEPPIPGYDVFLILGVISLVAIILMKKIKSK
jgi:peptide/nickel transport system substrate-binding protein